MKLKIVLVIFCLSNISSCTNKVAEKQEIVTQVYELDNNYFVSGRDTVIEFGNRKITFYGKSDSLVTESYKDGSRLDYREVLLLDKDESYFYAYSNQERLEMYGHEIASVIQVKYFDKYGTIEEFNYINRYDDLMDTVFIATYKNGLIDSVLLGRPFELVNEGKPNNGISLIVPDGYYLNIAVDNWFLTLCESKVISLENFYELINTETDIIDFQIDLIPSFVAGKKISYRFDVKINFI